MLRCESDTVSAWAQGFSFDSSLYVLSRCGGHGLDANWVFASNGSITDANFSSGYALGEVARNTVRMVFGLGLCCLIHQVSLKVKAFPLLLQMCLCLVLERWG